MGVQSLVDILQKLRRNRYIAERTVVRTAVLLITEAGGLGLAEVVATDARDAAQRVAGDAARLDGPPVDRRSAIVGESD